jgi:glyoxylase-like metal-dependent hydrolase (beta-lactamase superfamily II)
MKTIRLAATLSIFLIAFFVIEAQEREADPVTLQKISDHTYQVNGGSGANGGVIIGENEIIVIDSKMDEISVKQTLKAIGGVSFNPVTYLVNTHSDGDHIMGNRYFPPSVKVVAHENCREDFFKENFGRPSDWDEPANYPFTPSITFKERMNIWMGKERVELHYYGKGHTAGDIIVFVPDEKVAFIGDLFFQDRPQLIHSNKEGNSFEYVQTLSEILEDLDAEIFISGHSVPVGRSEMKKQIQAMEMRQDKVKELMGEGLNLEEVLSHFDENESRLVTSIYGEISNE